LNEKEITMSSMLKRSLVPVLVLSLFGACLLAAPAQAAPQRVDSTGFGISWLTDWMPSWLHGFWSGLGETADSNVTTDVEEPGRIFDRDGAVLEPDGAPSAQQEGTLTRSLRGEEG
jgi:hypothetical protein